MRASQATQFGNVPSMETAKMANTGFGRQANSNGFAVGANPIEGKGVTPDGPTSFASIYNKRNMYATVNDSFARVGNTPAQAETIQRQVKHQMQGQMPWGSTGYNYDAGFQRKRL